MMMSIVDPFETFNREFDRMFPAKVAATAKPSYPPYNLIEWTPEKFTLEFAVAGFNQEQIDISVEKGILIVKGEQEEEAGEINYLHKGIAARKFVRKFELPEYVEVSEASLTNGILSIELVKEIPEEEKPKKITIK